MGIVKFNKHNLCGHLLVFLLACHHSFPRHGPRWHGTAESSVHSTWGGDFWVFHGTPQQMDDLGLPLLKTETMEKMDEQPSTHGDPCGISASRGWNIGIRSLKTRASVKSRIRSTQADAYHHPPRVMGYYPNNTLIGESPLAWWHSHTPYTIFWPWQM